MSSSVQAISPIQQVPHFDWHSQDPKSLIQAINIVGNIITLYGRDLAQCATGPMSLDADTAQVGERVVLDHALQWYVSKCGKSYSFLTDDMPLHQTIRGILHPFNPGYHLHLAYDGGITTQDLRCILEGIIQVQDHRLTPEKRKWLIENKWLRPNTFSFLKACKAENFDQFMQESSSQSLIPHQAKNSLLKHYEKFCKDNPDSLYYFEKAKEYIDKENAAYWEALTEEIFKFGYSFGTGAVFSFTTGLLRETSTLSQKKIDVLRILPLAIWAGYNLLAEETIAPGFIMEMLKLFSERTHRYLSIMLFSILLTLSLVSRAKETMSDALIPDVTISICDSFLINVSGYCLGSVTGNYIAKAVAPSVSFWAERTQSTVKGYTQTVSAWVNSSGIPFLAQRSKEILSASGELVYEGCKAYLNSVSS